MKKFNENRHTIDAPRLSILRCSCDHLSLIRTNIDCRQILRNSLKGSLLNWNLFKFSIFINYLYINTFQAFQIFASKCLQLRATSLKTEMNVTVL
jgi:hypothetical protein